MDKEILEILKLAGVSFTIYLMRPPGGCLNLEIEQLLEYIKEPELWRDKWCADYYGVSLDEKFYSWLNYDHYCIAITAKGTRCKNFALLASPTPNSFNFDDCLCGIHQKVKKDGKIISTIKSNMTKDNIPPIWL